MSGELSYHRGGLEPLQEIQQYGFKHIVRVPGLRLVRAFPMYLRAVGLAVYKVVLMKKAHESVSFIKIKLSCSVQPHPVGEIRSQN